MLAALERPRAVYSKHGVEPREVVVGDGNVCCCCLGYKRKEGILQRRKAGRIIGRPCGRLMRRIAHRVERGEERVEPGPRGDGGVHALGGDEAEVERRRGGRDHGDGVLDGHEEEKAAPEERRQRVPPQHAGRRAPVGPPPPTRRGGRAHLPPLRAAAVRRLGDRVEDLAAGLLVAPARDSRGGGICAWRGVAWAGVGWAK
jgi:hypothetical protein